MERMFSIIHLASKNFKNKILCNKESNGKSKWIKWLNTGSVYGISFDRFESKKGKRIENSDRSVDDDEEDRDIILTN